MVFPALWFGCGPNASGKSTSPIVSSEIQVSKSPYEATKNNHASADPTLTQPCGSVRALDGTRFDPALVSVPTTPQSLSLTIIHPCFNDRVSMANRLTDPLSIHK